MDSKAAKTFIAAGHAIFTIDNGKGEHFTFKVTTPDDTNKALDYGFLSVLTGPDNTRDYTYAGTVDFREGTIRQTKKSKISPDALSWRVAKWFLNCIWLGRPIPEGYQIRHEGRCGRCGRRLTHPDSLTNGIGPECQKHV